MRQNKSERCVGIDQDNDGGMAGTGRKIRDARAFDLLHETETCSGWNAPAIEQLWKKTGTE